MKFDDAVKFIENYIPQRSQKYPGKLGLERMKYLVSMLGDPQFSYPVIHVGGTSGKGSTATMIASILATKYKVGLHTSPHLIKVNERMKIVTNNKYVDITDGEFVEMANEIKPYVKKMKRSKYRSPSYFEIVTAMAFLYFKQQKVGLAVIEVGMGGRFDGTNVVNPLVAVLTNVGLDHTEVLGNTIEKIAEDKVGIIKSGIRVVSGINQPPVIKIVGEKCRKENAVLSLLNRDFSYHIRDLSDDGSVFDYQGEQTYKNVKLSLLGKHQVENAALAINVIEKLRNLVIGEEGIRKGLLSAKIPGRMEIVSKKPLIILDGAHNADKAKALAEAIRDIFPKKEVIAVVAIKPDKDAALIIKELIKITDEFIFTRYKVIMDTGKIVSFDPEKLAEITRKINRKKKILIEPDPQRALTAAKKEAGDHDLILITGSLYLVGEMMRIIKDT